MTVVPWYCHLQQIKSHEALMIPELKAAGWLILYQRQAPLEYDFCHCNTNALDSQMRSDWTRWDYLPNQNPNCWARWEQRGKLSVKKGKKESQRAAFLLFFFIPERSSRMSLNQTAEEQEHLFFMGCSVWNIIWQSMGAAKIDPCLYSGALSWGDFSCFFKGIR